MTSLQRTDLPTSQKVEFAAQALARQEHGAITALSREFGVSRPTVYTVAQTAEQVLEQHFEQARAGTVYLEVDQAQLQRAIIALRVVAPNSIRAIEELLPLLYPGQRLSYGKIQQLLVEAEAHAERFNQQVPLSAIRAGALDELFSQGDPVLAGIDLDSGYLFALAVGEDRSAESWAQVLRLSQAQDLQLEVVVKDAARGIAAGVKAVFPEAEQRDDCFHAHYEMGKVAQRLERRAYAAIQREAEVLDQLQRTRAGERKRRRQLKQKLAWARRKCRQAIADYDAFAAAVEHTRRAMSWVDLDTGQIRCAEQVHTEICQAAQAMRAVDYRGCGKVADYLTNRAPGLACYAAQLHAQLVTLTGEYGEPLVSLAAAIVQLSDDLQQQRGAWHRREQSQHLIGAYQRLHQQLGHQADRLVQRVQALWQQRHRASSAIESFNAALRPYLYLHKGVTQGFLELFRAYFNLRTRRWGPRQGTCAYQQVTGQPLNDWLTLLGFPPTRAVH